MTCGIYMIKNSVSLKAYIGQSINVERRFCVHKAKLRHNSHWNKHLQLAWLKEGEAKFEFTLLHQCDEAELSVIEQEWIQKLNTCSKLNGYNCTSGGEGGRQTEDVRKIMSKKAKGRKGYWTGKVIPDEARHKMSEAAKRRGCCKPTLAVIHLETGIKYKSCAEAARAVFPDIPAATDLIYKVSRGFKPSYRKTTWQLAKEDDSGSSI